MHSGIKYSIIINIAYIDFQIYPKNLLIEKIILLSLNLKKYWYWLSIVSS